MCVFYSCKTLLFDSGEAAAAAIARAQVSLIRQATMDAHGTPRRASCLSDVARVFAKHLSAEVSCWRVA
jgi:hypothetical protein